MRKTLSLKKTQAVPPANQKSITQFFKNDNNSKPCHQNENEKLSKHAGEDVVQNKRKALSPILVDSPYIPNSSSVQHEKSNKKIKLSQNHTSCSPKKSTHNKDKQVSPRKENNKHKSAHITQDKQELSLIKDSEKSVTLKLVENGSNNMKPEHSELSTKCSPQKKVKASENRKKSPQKKALSHGELLSPDKIIIKKNHNNGASPVKMDFCNGKLLSPDKINIKKDDSNHNSPIKSPSKRNDFETKELGNIQQYFSPEKLSKNNHGSRHTTPVKSPFQVKCPTPISSNSSSKETVSLNASPSKIGSTVRTLCFAEYNGVELGDMFDGDWEFNEVDEGSGELDLSVMQRCEILEVIQHPSRFELRLKNICKQRGTCYIEGFWLDTPLCPGDIIGVIATREPSGNFKVDNCSGLLVLRPDHLVSSTSVVAGVFCKRKAVLQDRWRGLDSANAAMTIGSIIHELVQKALKELITDITRLKKEAEIILKESIQMIYDAGLTEEEVRNNMQIYIMPLADFMQSYFCRKSSNSNLSKKDQKNKWKGHINKVLDIEENLCCPQLGLKGKIDATLEVTIHQTKGDKQHVVPLELKSGKASMSAEHRGQLVLYGMMLSALQKQDPTRSEQRGLLLYLKDRVELQEISCGYPERRDLIMLRNQLVQHLATSPHDTDPEQLVDIEEASSCLQQKLPDPINRENICSKCPYLTICSLHLWNTDEPRVSESHSLSKLRDTALGHISPEHIKYFLNWTALLKMEDKGHSHRSPLHSLWTDSAEIREKKGTCAANLKLKSVVVSDTRFLHIFEKQRENKGYVTDESHGPQEGEYCIVSTVDRAWIAAGVVALAKDSEIHMYLERDLSRRSTKSTVFHVDQYESYASTVQNLTNLGVLLEDTERSQRLRRLIIDKEAPEFDKKLPREVGRLGAKLMRSLNIEQQRAVLRALAAKDYCLLRGLPGTGKTQTISVLIQMLVALKQRVLVTAHTHSAVDTVLSRLPKSIRMMRLGTKARVAARLVDLCEQSLVASCSTTKDLENLYDSMEVVGVTCLGAAHAMLSRTTFDVCIVDEATQVLQCTVLRPLFAARRFVLVGDPDQLPPVVRSRAARRMGMEESLFHRLMTEESTSTLQLQYRMNGPLAEVANKVAYNGQLKCAGDAVAEAKLNIDLQKISQYLDCAPWISVACSPESEHAAVFLDLQTEESSHSKTRSNYFEASVVMALIDALIEGGVQSSDIGVVAPFRDQVSLLKRCLAGRVEASTVDQFQGRDKPVILYSCTKKNCEDDKTVKDGDILNDQRRLAVSVTRAKHKLVVIGDSRALRRYGPLLRLIDACHTLVLTKQHINDVQRKYSHQLGK